MTLDEAKQTPEGALSHQMEAVQHDTSKEHNALEQPKLVNPVKTALNKGIQAGLSGALAMSLQV